MPIDIMKAYLNAMPAFSLKGKYEMPIIVFVTISLYLE